MIFYINETTLRIHVKFWNHNLRGILKNQEHLKKNEQINELEAVSVLEQLKEMWRMLSHEKRGLRRI